jgi:hypothetical protein
MTETTPETIYELTGNFLKGYVWKRTAPDGTITEGHAKTFEAANDALFRKDGKDV